MQRRACGTGGCRHFGAAESIERMHGKMLLEHARGVLGKEGVTIVGNRIRQVAELRSLMIGDQQLRWRNARELIGELVDLEKFAEREFASRVIDQGEAERFSMAENGCEVVRSLVIKQREVVDRSW